MPDPIEIGGRGGSSPLARGLRRVVAARGLARRIIPARAGFTRYRRRRKPRRPDHPRSRGVYTWADSSWEEEYGSSPLARGLPVAGLWTHVLRRIIPARAGFTQRDTASTRNLRGSSPLARGLLTTTVHPPGARRGSSPLARGLPKEQALAVLRLGIIPARAGFTGRRRRHHLPDPDHPRSRGVYPTCRARRGRPRGSSPLARGLRVRLTRIVVVLRIIPARAGFTRAIGWSRPSWTDHPRSRGVYEGGGAAAEAARGSSPLARGLLPYRLSLGRDGRIIPARAGFTQPHRPRRQHRPDHPRSRGVYRGGCSRALSRLGSSPLARGLPGGDGPRGDDAGIIPARAGFTLADPWNPNEPVLYQTPVAFTADLGPAPPSCGSAAVVLRWTTTPSGA